MLLLLLLLTTLRFTCDAVPVLEDDTWDMELPLDDEGDDEGRSYRIKTSKPLMVLCDDQQLDVHRPPSPSGDSYILVRPGGSMPSGQRNPCVVTRLPPKTSTRRPTSDEESNIAFWPPLGIILGQLTMSTPATHQVRVPSPPPVSSTTIQTDFSWFLPISPSVDSSNSLNNDDISNQIHSQMDSSLTGFEANWNDIIDIITPSPEVEHTTASIHDILHPNLIYSTPPSNQTEVEVECGCDAGLLSNETNLESNTPRPVTSGFLQISPLDHSSFGDDIKKPLTETTSQTVSTKKSSIITRGTEIPLPPFIDDSTSISKLPITHSVTSIITHTSVIQLPTKPPKLVSKPAISSPSTFTMPIKTAKPLFPIVVTTPRPSLRPFDPPKVTPATLSPTGSTPSRLSVKPSNAQTNHINAQTANPISSTVAGVTGTNEGSPIASQLLKKTMWYLLLISKHAFFLFLALVFIAAKNYQKNPVSPPYPSPSSPIHLPESNVFQVYHTSFIGGAPSNVVYPSEGYNYPSYPNNLGSDYVPSMQYSEVVNYKLPPHKESEQLNYILNYINSHNSSSSTNNYYDRRKSQ